MERRMFYLYIHTLPFYVVFVLYLRQDILPYLTSVLVFCVYVFVLFCLSTFCVLCPHKYGAKQLKVKQYTCIYRALFTKSVFKKRHIFLYVYLQ
jgi:hypothetical protein